MNILLVLEDDEFNFPNKFSLQIVTAREIHSLARAAPGPALRLTSYI